MQELELKTPDDFEPKRHNSVAKDDPDVRQTTKITWRHLTLGPVIFLYFAGLSMALFVTNQYLYRRIQMEEYPNKTFDTGSSFCTRNASDIYRQTRVQKTTALYFVAFALLAGIPAIFVNIFLGAYSDSYGRKFVMIYSMSGTLIRVLISLIGVYIQMDLKLFAIGFFLEGLCGQPFNFLLSIYSYASDVTTRENRAIGFVLAELCVGLGSALPTFAVGYYVQAKGFKETFILCVAFIVVAMLLAVFVVPESFPKERRAKKSEKCINLKHAIGFYFSSSNAGKRWKYNVTIVVFFLTMTCLLGRNQVETLYQMNAPFCWTPTKLGWYGALRTGLQQVLSMFMVAVLRKFLSEEAIAMIGCVSFAAAFILEALAKTDTVIYIVTLVGALGVLAIPMTRTILSRMTSHTKQGALAASISAVETTCHMFAIVAMNAIYQSTVKDFGGAVFIVMASLNGVAFVFLAILKFGSRGNKEDADGIRPVSIYMKPSTDL